MAQSLSKLSEALEVYSEGCSFGMPGNKIVDALAEALAHSKNLLEGCKQAKKLLLDIGDTGDVEITGRLAELIVRLNRIIAMAEGKDPDSTPFI